MRERHPIRSHPPSRLTQAVLRRLLRSHIRHGCIPEGVTFHTGRGHAVIVDHEIHHDAITRQDGDLDTIIRLYEELESTREQLRDTRAANRVHNCGDPLDVVDVGGLPFECVVCGLRYSRTDTPYSSAPPPPTDPEDTEGGRP